MLWGHDFNFLSIPMIFSEDRVCHYIPNKGPDQDTFLCGNASRADQLCGLCNIVLLPLSILIM